jgi:F-type H+-transporting ATPase subunit b
MVSRIVAGSSVLLLARGSVFASGGESDPSMLVMPQFGLIFWTFVTFLLLAFVLGRFAWKPLLGAIEARERSIEESLDQARTEREEAEKLLEEHKALVAQARRERAEAMAEGQRDAERIKGDIVEEGRKQREKLLEQAEAQIQAEMRQARAELRGIAADLSIKAAGRLLSSQLDEQAQRRLVEEYLDELEQMSDGSRPVS